MDSPETTAFDRLERLVAQLRQHRVHAFKGELRVSDAVVWTIDLAFEKPEPTPTKRVSFEE